MCDIFSVLTIHPSIPRFAEIKDFLSETNDVAGLFAAAHTMFVNKQQRDESAFQNIQEN